MSQVEPQTLDLKAALALLYADIQVDLERVDKRLRRELKSQYPRVDEVLRHGYRLGGKRLRPALVLLAAKTTGRVGDAHHVLATVVEMIHTATLVHDDVLDEAALRRHVDTVNARWNNETSVLLGDFLFSHAFYLASTLDSVEACRLIGRSTNVVCEGELRQTLCGGNLNLTEEEYFSIIDAKTAELCACCCELGARYSGAEGPVVSRLASFGRNLGIAFQIADDLLDLQGQEEETGKSLGTDLAKLKLTLPLIHARDMLQGAARSQWLALLKSAVPGDLPTIRARLEELGSLEYAALQAKLYADRAVEDLAILPAGRTRETLGALAQFAACRGA